MRLSSPAHSKQCCRCSSDRPASSRRPDCSRGSSGFQAGSSSRQPQRQMPTLAAAHHVSSSDTRVRSSPAAKAAPVGLPIRRHVVAVRRIAAALITSPFSSARSYGEVVAAGVPDQAHRPAIHDTLRPEFFHGLPMRSRPFPANAKQTPSKEVGSPVFAFRPPPAPASRVVIHRRRQEPPIRRAKCCRCRCWSGKTWMSTVCACAARGPTKNAVRPSWRDNPQARAPFILSRCIWLACFWSYDLDAVGPVVLATRRRCSRNGRKRRCG